MGDILKRSRCFFLRENLRHRDPTTSVFTIWPKCVLFHCESTSSHNSTQLCPSLIQPALFNVYCDIKATANFVSVFHVLAPNTLGPPRNHSTQIVKLKIRRFRSFRGLIMYLHKEKTLQETVRDFYEAAAWPCYDGPSSNEISSPLYNLGRSLSALKVRTSIFILPWQHCHRFLVASPTREPRIYF